jgi:signal transduction histidine kinase
MKSSLSTESVSLETLITDRLRFLLKILLTVCAAVLLLSVFGLGLLQVKSNLRTLESWLELNQTRIEEAMYLKNASAVEFRTKEIQSRCRWISSCSASVSDRFDSRELGVSESVWGVRIVRPLMYANTTVGRIEVKSKLTLPGALFVFVPAFLVSVAFYFWSHSILGNFLGQLRTRILDPLLLLRQGMEQDELKSQAGQNTLPVDAVREVKELSLGYFSVLQRLREASEREIKQARLLSQVELARQVAHDIRSPLAAFQVVLKEVDGMEESARVLLGSAIQRIRAIADQMLERGHSIEKPLEAWVALLTEQVVEEKRLQYPDAQIINDFSPLPPLAVFCGISDWKRVLSNLLENAIQASPKAARIWIRAERHGARLRIQIQDQGRGIAPEILSQIGERGFSFGKHSGSGLGLSFAREKLSLWGGTLSVASELEVGTTVTLDIPSAISALWMCAEIDLRCAQTIYVLDDDPEILERWKRRTSSATWVGMLKLPGAPPETQALYLVDDEFRGATERGLEWIERHGLWSNSVLVTHRWEDVQHECARRGLRLLPKTLIERIPLRT